MATNYSTQEALNMLVELYQIIIANGGGSGSSEPDPEGGSSEPGSKWLSGESNPDTLLGAIGDWYLNTITYDVFKKTGEATWTLSCNIKGAPGTNGTNGVDGAPGTNGTNGVDGSIWLTAAGAPAGATGKIKDWYLNISNYDIYEKTGSSTWTSRGNIKGVDGVNGVGSIWLTAAGAPAGATGKITDWYLNTTNYDVYEKTGSSTWTLRGNIKGATGATGSTGTAGTNGSQWLTGTTTPGTGTGVIGDWYLNTTNYDIHQKTGSSTWTNKGNIKGATGATGAAGTNATFTYSTNETFTGNYWIDGKEVYRKVINIGQLPNATTKNVAHGITGLSWVISSETYSSNGTNFSPIPYTGSSSINIYINNTNVIISASTNYSTYNTAYTVLLYTK